MLYDVYVIGNADTKKMGEDNDLEINDFTERENEAEQKEGRIRQQKQIDR